MNRPDTVQHLFPIPDTQSARDDREIAIDRVGIKGLKYPLLFVDQDGVAQPTVADCDVFVALPGEQKGTHMSRLVALLEARTAPGSAPLSVASFRGLLDELVALLEAPGGRMEFAFPFFIRKTAPVSGVASLLDYQVRIAGELLGGDYAQLLTIAAPVTSLCPCSKEISDYGAHNQRSVVSITVRATAPCSDRDHPRRPRRKPPASSTGSEACRREVRDREGVQQPALRRGPRPRRRGAARRRSAPRRLHRRGRELRVDPQPLRLRPDRARALTPAGCDMGAVPRTMRS